MCNCAQCYYDNQRERERVLPSYRHQYPPQIADPDFDRHYEHQPDHSTQYYYSVDRQYDKPTAADRPSRPRKRVSSKKTFSSDLPPLPVPEPSDYPEEYLEQDSVEEPPSVSHIVTISHENADDMETTTQHQTELVEGPQEPPSGPPTTLIDLPPETPIMVGDLKALFSALESSLRASLSSDKPAVDLPSDLHAPAPPPPLSNPQAPTSVWFDETTPLEKVPVTPPAHTSENTWSAERKAFEATLHLLKDRNHLNPPEVDFIEFPQPVCRPGEDPTSTSGPPLLPLHKELTGWYDWSSAQLDRVTTKTKLGTPFPSCYVNQAKRLYTTKTGEHAILNQPRELPSEYLDLSTYSQIESARSTTQSLATCSTPLLTLLDNNNRVAESAQSYNAYFSSAAVEECQRARFLLQNNVSSPQVKLDKLTTILDNQFYFLDAAAKASKEVSGALVNSDVNLTLKRRDTALAKLLPPFSGFESDLRNASFTSKNLLPPTADIVKDTTKDGVASNALFKLLLEERMKRSSSSIEKQPKKDIKINKGQKGQHQNAQSFRTTRGGGRGGYKGYRKDSRARSRSQQRTDSRPPTRARSSERPPSKPASGPGPSAAGKRFQKK